MPARTVSMITIELRETETGEVDIEVVKAPGSLGRNPDPLSNPAMHLVASAQKPLTFHGLPRVGRVFLTAKLPGGKRIKRELALGRS